MHEYPITCEIIRISESYAKENGALKILKIGLVVGEYSGFVGDSIHMYFHEISIGTMCEDSTIDIRYIKPKLKCTNCGELFERQLFSFNCPKCNGAGGPTEIGKEFYIEYIEILDKGGEVNE